MYLKNKQSQAFIDWYKERYKGFDDIIDKTSMEMIGIPEENDISDWKDFLKSILKKDYDKKIKHRWGYQINGESLFNYLYSNFGPKGMSEIKSE